MYVCATGASSSGSFGVLSVSAFVVLISMVFERKRVYSVRESVCVSVRLALSVCVCIESFRALHLPT